MKKSIYAIVLFTHQRSTKYVKVFQRDLQRVENRIQLERIDLKLNVEQFIRLHKCLCTLYTNKQGGESLHYQLTATKSGVINSLFDRQSFCGLSIFRSLFCYHLTLSLFGNLFALCTPLSFSVFHNYLQELQ